MACLLPITVIVAARNEERNIARCLSSLSSAEKTYVVDSSSEDSTAALALAHGAEVARFQYSGGYPKKRQWAVDTLQIKTPWVMFVDADEVIPAMLWQEIREQLGAGVHDAFLVTKGFHFLGRRFRFGGFSHSAVILFRAGRARFERLLVAPPITQDMEVHERLIVAGRIGRLRTHLVHEDFKGLEAYIDRHNRYSTWEALVRQQFLSHGTWGTDTIRGSPIGDSQERRRWLKSIALRVPFEPQLWFLYHYILRLGAIEGRAGLIASRLRANYVADVHAKLHELEKAVSTVKDGITRAQP